MKIISILVAGALLSGCASIVSESQYPVTINSSPEGAAFSIINKKGITVYTGETPFTVNLKSGNGYFKGETYTIKFKKDGYEEKTYTVDSKLDGWYWGNILFGGLIGMLIVDPATGSMWKLPEHEVVQLNKTLASKSEGSSLHLISVNELSDTQKQQLIALN